MALKAADIRVAVQQSPGTNAFRTYALKEAAPVLKILWQAAPWYVRVFFNLVDAIHDFIEEEESKPTAERGLPLGESTEHKREG